MGILLRTSAVIVLPLLLGACSPAPRAPDEFQNGIYPPGDPPLPAPPKVSGKECLIDLGEFEIRNDGSDPEETTQGINRALSSLAAEGCGRVKLPAGLYTIGKKISDAYTAGIELPGGMIFELDDEAVLKLRPTDTWAYCIINISGVNDVGIVGGSIVGDRDEHDFKVPGDEGHCICIENESERIAIDRVRLSKAIGDGVLILGQGGDGSSSKDISITNSEIHDNRRQGVSIVGGVRVLIENNEIHHIEGTAPQFGIDIESLNFESRDITIRKNRFHHNRGGDFVNTDGRGVLFEENSLEDGEGNQYIDGPVIYWSNTDQIIRNNQITMARGSANGKMGILEYSHDAPRTNSTRNIIEGNRLEGCSINVQKDSLVTIRGNTVRGPSAAYIVYKMKGVELIDNVLEKDGWSYSYMIHDSTGVASGNTLNGEPYDISMTLDAPFSNWDGR